MTTYDSQKGFILTTDANTNKNLSSNLYTFSSPSVGVPSGGYVLRTYTIPLSVNTRMYQIYLNLSIDGDLWTTMPARDRFYSGGDRVIATNMSQGGSSITLNIWLTNPSPSTQVFADMTVSVTRRDFVDEI